MVKTILPCLIAGCLTAAHFAHTADYGVGFGFSLDYGVASIYFSNGSNFDIAKIEGGAAYKQVMRAPVSIDTRHLAQHPTVHDPTETGNAAAQTPLGQYSLRDWLPPWFGGQDSRTQSLSRMLKALKTATESFLEAPLSDAEIVVPFPVSETHRVALRAACSSLSLHMPMSAQPPAGILAARAYGIGRDCNLDITNSPSERSSGNDPEQLILTVDYSRAALTVLLVSEECSIFEAVRVMHDTSLGTDGLYKGSHTSGYNVGRAQLAQALRDITSLPLKTGNGAGLTVISELVMVGESADDPRLHDALVEVLFEQFPSLFTAFGEGRPKRINPVFAASRGLAQDCEDRLNFESNSGRLDAL